MDQNKIGRFIADCRKNIGFTQMQLAEKLGITDKEISKWERGLAMPDAAIMLELCEILEISVNELLSGERLTMESSSKNNEQLLLDMAKDLENKNKIIWSSMWMIMIVSMIALLAGVFIAALFVPQGVWQLVIIVGVCVVFLIPCFYALRLEVSVGAYKCSNCGYEIVPTYKDVMMSLHRGFTRRLLCPKCNKRTWCKKIIKK